MKKIIFSVVFIAIIALLIIFNPFGSSGKSDASIVRSSTAVIDKGNIVISIISTGIIEPIHTVELKSKASGEIIDFSFEEGDRVKKGELILRLDPITARNEYDQAKADLDVAEASLSKAEKQAARAEKMFSQEMISEEEFENIVLEKEQANSSLVRARTSLSDAEEQLSDTEIESPINGLILTKLVEEGQIIASGISAVSGGTTIATIADLSRVYVRASVDEVDIGQIQAGQKATVIAESYPDREFEGIIKRIHPQAIVESNVTTFDVTIEIDNSDELLMAGMNASVEITAGFKENVLLVPREALSDARSMFRMAGMNPSGNRNGGGGGRPQQAINHQSGQGDNPGGGNDGKSGKSTKMVIVTNNGEQDPRPVEIGLANFEVAEVVSGLAEGDTVLTTVSSKALQDREQLLERMKRWNQLPGRK